MSLTLTPPIFDSPEQILRGGGIAGQVGWTNDGLQILAYGHTHHILIFFLWWGLFKHNPLEAFCFQRVFGCQDVVDLLCLAELNACRRWHHY